MRNWKNKEKVSIAVEKLIPLVKQEAADLRDIHKYLISSVTTWGSLGNITNWQQHNIPGQILPQIKQIVKITGDSSWVAGLFPDNIAEVSRIIVPSPQTMIQEGNDYTVKVICFNIKPETARIYWRSLGNKEYQQADLKKISETYWMATIPSKASQVILNIISGSMPEKNTFSLLRHQLSTMQLYKSKIETQIH